MENKKRKILIKKNKKTGKIVPPISRIRDWEPEFPADFQTEDGIIRLELPKENPIILDIDNKKYEFNEGSSNIRCIAKFALNRANEIYCNSWKIQWKLLKYKINNVIDKIKNYLWKIKSKIQK